MKKVIITPALILISVLLTYTTFSQARKYVLFEHFTNASCAPCATQNPIFDSTVLAKNCNNIVHIAYHTYWPGVDPMNEYNPEEVQHRVSFYGVTGVPNIRMNGTRYTGGPAGVTQSMITSETSESSPIRIKVDEESDGDIRNVTITVYTLGNVPVGNYRLKAAVVEKKIEYTSAPGSNGELRFPDVFRKAIPDTTGDIYNPAPIGDSVVFEYSYALDTETWISDNIYCTVYIQDEYTKEVLNAASSLTTRWEMINQGNYFIKADEVSESFFMSLENYENNEKSFLVKLTTEQPDDWTAQLTYNDETYSDSLYITLQPAENANININVTTGETPAVTSYMTSVIDQAHPESAGQGLEFNIIKGVTDLIVNNDGMWGDNLPNP